jgi:polyphosphate kinase 2 (PPK2 family)
MTRRIRMTVNSKDVRVQKGEQVKLKNWPTRTEPCCRSKRHCKKLLGEHVEELLDEKTIGKERYRSILDLERHLNQNGTRIVKFFLRLFKQLEGKEIGITCE